MFDPTLPDPANANLTLARDCRAHYDLLLFDLDGTLVADYHATQLSEGRELLLAALLDADLALAICTNAGGVGLRLAFAKWKKSREEIEALPTVTSHQARLKKVFRSFAVDIDAGRLRLYSSYAYVQAGIWYSDLADKDTKGALNPAWTLAWRKPNPGMLLQACADASVAPDRTLMVGDREEDQQAAAAAACHFRLAVDFFPPPRP